MTEHEALLIAQNRVKPPKKDGLEWVVEWLENGTWKQKRFITDDGAYVYFYTCIRLIKQNLLKNQRSR